MNRNSSSILSYCLAAQATLLMFLVCVASAPALAASAASQQASTRIVEPEQVKPGDRITVYEKSGRELDLIVEEVATTDQTNQHSNLAGTFVSDITDKENKYFRAKYKQLVVTLEQHGEKVTGKVSSLADGYLEGVREGDTIKFHFYSTTISNYEIKGEWKLSADANTLEGSWKHTVVFSSGQWNLTRLGPEAARHAEPPTIKGRLVSDHSVVEVTLADIDRIEKIETWREGEEEKSDKEGHDGELDNSSSGDEFSKAAGEAVKVVATMIGLVIVGLFELIFLFVLAL